MRILVAPDKFKGSLTAVEAAHAIENGFRDAWPDADIRCVPVADGGEGTSDALREALGGTWIELKVRDPLGRLVVARYAWMEGSATAAIEMSAASGLWRVGKGERNPLRSTTFGTGQLLLDAVNRGARKVIVGIGGSATNDGGMGLAAALGFYFLDNAGKPIEPVPQNLGSIHKVVAPASLRLPTIVVACDVRNPLLGERGATRVYGPQKGVTSDISEILESGLRHFADVVARSLACDFRNTPGAGAAGGLGFGLLTFCKARLEPGFDLIAGTTGLEIAITESDLVITGEGCIDSQTLEGKAPAGVAALARKHGKPVIAFGGTLADQDRIDEVFDGTCSLVSAPIAIERAVAEAAPLLRRAACRAAHLIRIGQAL